MSNSLPRNDRDLNGIKLFAGMDPAGRAAIGRQCEWRRCEQGQMIVFHHDPSRDIFFVARGGVRAVVHSLTGKQVSYRDIGAGGMFGEFSAIDGKPRSASVVALTDCLIAALDAGRFWQALRDHPSVAEELLKHLTGLLRLYSDRMRELATLPVATRVQIELLRLAMPDPSNAEVSIIDPPPTHLEIAERIGTHREAVTKSLSALRRDGTLQIARGSLIVENPSRLQQLVAEVLGD